MEEDLFDNGIDGEPFDSPAEDYAEEESYREDFDVHSSPGLEIKGWPTYGNYTIITDTFHMFLWPGGRKLDIYDLRKPIENGLHEYVLQLSNIDLYFFGEKNGPEQDDRWNIDFYTADQIDHKIQRYLNLKAFL